MTISSYKLTGKVPVVGVDGKTRWNGNVRLDDEVTRIDALVLCGALEAPEPSVELAAGDDGDDADVKSKE